MISEIDIGRSRILQMCHVFLEVFIVNIHESQHFENEHFNNN